MAQVDLPAAAPGHSLQSRAAQCFPACLSECPARQAGGVATKPSAGHGVLALGTVCLVRASSNRSSWRLSSRQVSSCWVNHTGTMRR